MWWFLMAAGECCSVSKKKLELSWKWWRSDGYWDLVLQPFLNASVSTRELRGSTKEGQYTSLEFHNIDLYV
jgi:hypothetical protein